jgi:CHAT domain-containing protein
MQVLDIQKKQEQFIKGLETKNPTYFRYKYDTTLVSLDKVKKYLGSDQTLLEYFVGDNTLYALQVSENKVMMYSIDAKNYANNATRFLSYCVDNQKANQDFKGFLNVSNQLYQQMFKNIYIPKGRLIIAQDGFFIPFEALSKSAQNANYLLNDYAISYTYSMLFLLKNLGQKSFSIRNKFMGMSPVNFSKNLNQTALLGSDISLANITSNFFLGKNFNQNEATKRTFLNDAHNYQIVHLYTHAQADSSDQEPMIYFKDSVLKLSELSDLERFNTQLMVLSACKTAVGKNAKGEGILSLSRGFAALGIPATLTTLWSVENQATYTLNELFYRYLSKGYSKDVSLQKAKLEFLQSQSGEKQLPTFWAAAVLVGDAEAVTFNNFWLYIIVGVSLFLVGFWWYQKNKKSYKMVR